MSGPSGCPCLKSASFLPHLPSSSFLTISHFQPLFVLLPVASPFLTSPPNPISSLSAGSSSSWKGLSLSPYLQPPSLIL